MKISIKQLNQLIERKIRKIYEDNYEPIAQLDINPVNDIEIEGEDKKKKIPLQIDPIRSDDPNFNNSPIQDDEASVDEMSTSAGAGAYLTPGAFAATTSDNIATQAGMKVVGKKEKADSLGSGARVIKRKKEADTTLPTVRHNFAENKKDTNMKLENFIETIVKKKLQEASYQDFIGGTDDTPKRKVNNAIHEISSNLLRIERLARHAKRLKSEANITTNNYWTETKRRITKIQERITKLSHIINDLGA